MPLIFDRSLELGLALIAEADLSAPRYVPLSEAQGNDGQVALPYLQQLHAVANGELIGLHVRMKMPMNPRQWACLGRLAGRG